MSFPVLFDEEVRRLAGMGALIPVVEECLRAKAAGRLTAPPRHAVTFGDHGRLVFTVGGIEAPKGTVADGSAIAGFRAYETFAGPGKERGQVVAVWDSVSGNLLGLVVGEALGPLRTGAIGGVAIRHMARADARICAVIGAGIQAETQLLAAAAVRRLTSVRVFSRSIENRARFARRMAERLDLPVRPAASARDAVEGAHVVLCATTSARPVFDAAWLAPGAHVTTVGPKIAGSHELPVEIGARAGLIATDSPEQLRAYPGGHFLTGTPGAARMLDLADLVAGGGPDREPDGISLFCSTGLAGTEVAVAAHLLARHGTAGTA